LTEITAKLNLERLLKKAGDGDLEAMTGAALVLVKENRSGSEEVFKRAFELYLQAAQGGFTTAQYNLGCMYMDGLGVERDCISAWHWLKEAADAGDYDAQFSLAILCEGGLAGPVDLQAARQWYKKAAENGSGRAQYDLACIYLHGKGVAVDRAQALVWFEQAAKSGVSRANTYLQQLSKECN